jgi:hypothetical protein
MVYVVMPLLCCYLMLAAGVGILPSSSANRCTWWMMALVVGFGGNNLNKLIRYRSWRFDLLLVRACHLGDGMLGFGVVEPSS